MNGCAMIEEQRRGGWEMKEIIQVERVSFRYGEEGPYALQDVDFSVKEGEWLAIVGHNGSGKSTLAKLLNGLLLPSSGVIRVEGFETNKKEEIWEIRRRVGMVFQNPDNQFVGTTVRDDVAFGLENIGIEREEMKRRIADSLEKVKMSAFLDQEPHRLSGGQKQRVAIAGILAMKPSVIILDESTSMLDPIGRKEVMETVRLLQKQENISVISITHDLEEVIHADRMIVMNKGKKLAEGTPREIFERPLNLPSIGLALPFSVLLSEQLQEKGMPLSEKYVTEEELVNAIWTLKSNN